MFSDARISAEKHCPGAVAEGIVFTPLEFGTKVVDVALVINTQVKDYLFSIEVPGPNVDHQHILSAAKEGVERVDCDLETLKVKLAEMPPTTTNARGLRPGDPVNLVIIGDFASVIGVFAARWDQTEIITLGSCWRTVKAFLLASEYRYSPVSALYLFQLPQDFALQRVRDSINERLHLRLWSTPLRFEGKEVWVGQVSRDIGVRLTWRTWNLTTHRIDPDVDEARDYVMEDLFEAGRIIAGGYVEGVGACFKESPRHNLTGDPYYSDGNRAVVMVSDMRQSSEVPQLGLSDCFPIQRVRFENRHANLRQISGGDCASRPALRQRVEQTVDRVDWACRTCRRGVTIPTKNHFNPLRGLLCSSRSILLRPGSKRQAEPQPGTVKHLGVCRTLISFQTLPESPTRNAQWPNGFKSDAS